MATYTKEVFKIGTTTKGTKSWMVVEVQGKEAGSTKVENIFDDKLKACFTAPGIYELGYEKKDKFWNVISAKLIQAKGPVSEHSQPPAPAAQPPKQDAPLKAPAPLDGVAAVRAGLAGSCALAAARVVQAMSGAGLLVDLTGDGVKALAGDIMDSLIIRGSEFVKHGKTNGQGPVGA